MLLSRTRRRYFRFHIRWDHRSGCRHWRRQRHRGCLVREFSPLNVAQKPLLASAKTLVREFPSIGYHLSKSISV
uniref:Uncharacterized protein MANES_14G027700 n=1 Tax=Rhizophora mucronata TaxID=61149 RepID=A0A2P2P1C9_RHIMU